MEVVGNDAVGRILASHATDELRSYVGNLKSAMRAIENNWLPEEKDSTFEPHIKSLQRHLSRAGHGDVDRYLVRLGLTVPGMQRGIHPPLIVLDANRGGLSAKRLREAEGQIVRLKESLAIGRVLLPNLTSDTQQAIHELLNIIQESPRVSDVTWIDWYRDLTAVQAEQLAELAVGYLDRAEKPLNDQSTRILQRLACFRDSPLTESRCSALIDREVFWPARIYRDSGNIVANQLISRVKSTATTLSLNHLLSALAWTRSSVAEDSFRAWISHPPRWASALYVPPARYTNSAAWCLAADGKRRELSAQRCHRIVLTKDALGPAVSCRTSLPQSCPCCSGPLSCLFDFSEVDEDYLPDDLRDIPKRVVCCLHCACYRTVFARCQQNGTAELITAGERCEFEYDGGPEPCCRVLDMAPFPLFAAAEPFGLSDTTTLGGVPMWLQDDDYPHCIECNQVMPFFAQHDNSPLPNEEGIYYAFYCPFCSISAVNFQQT